MVSSWISLNVEPRTYRTSRQWRWWRWWWKSQHLAKQRPRPRGRFTSAAPRCVIAELCWFSLTRFLPFVAVKRASTLCLFFQISSFLPAPPPPLPLHPSSHSGRAHGAFAAALVDGDGLYSLGNGELRLARLPPLGHHHLLQGHQKVGLPFAALFLVPIWTSSEC